MNAQLIERLAISTWQADYDVHETPFLWEELSPDQQARYRRHVVAVVEALAKELHLTSEQIVEHLQAVQYVLESGECQ